MASRLRDTGIAGALVGLTALGTLAVTQIGSREGKSNVAYPDIVGVWTICNGETRGVRKDDYKTDAECAQMLANGLVEFESGIRRCLKNPDAIPGKSYIQFLSLAWNIGVGAFCKSTVVKRLNANDMRGACNAIPLFNRAGGKVVRGLVIRRADEQRKCLEGLPA